MVYSQWTSALYCTSMTITGSTQSGISNAEFLCGKAEDVLQKHLEKSLGGRGEVIGVVDPPRGGLRKRPNRTVVGNVFSLKSSEIKINQVTYDFLELECWFLQQ